MSWVTRRLQTAPTWLFSMYCMIGAFGTYFCMYGFRKPFTAGTFAEDSWNGIGYKTVLIASQVFGYTLSKFIGIRVVSSMPAQYRGATILGLIAFAQLALVMFGLLPVPLNALALFANGLPLGMVFGLVLCSLEGRRVTEALTAGLCASFILASGVSKTLGRWMILDLGVSEWWMPSLTGFLFVVPLVFFVWMLQQIPPPTDADRDARSDRKPMTRTDRWELFRRHWIGLSALVLAYVCLTILRSFRDDFGVEIWQRLGYSDEPDVFARSEFWVMVVATVVNGMMIMIHRNRTALLTALTGTAISLAATVASVICWQADLLSGFGMMVSVGIGLYLPYVAFHTTLFERLIAAFRERGNIGFLMYLADAWGYFAYVGIIVFDQIAQGRTEQGAFDFLDLFISLTWICAGVGCLLLIAILIYYSWLLSADRDRHPDSLTNEK